MLVRIRIAAFLGLSVLLSFPAHRADALAADQWIMGYYVGYLKDELPPANIAWSDLTHIAMGPMTVNDDLTLNTDFDISPMEGPAVAKDIATRAHAAGRKAIIMLGGAGNGAAIANAVVPAHRAAFIRRLVSTMNRLGYDGLDLDWEDSVDWENFQSFVTALRTAAPTAILTIPVNTININYETVDVHLAAMAAQVDRINVMTYYPATAFTGFGWNSWFTSPLKDEKANTPVSIESSLERYAAAGVPNAKLGMGISFYAICYTGGITGPNQSTGDGSSVTIQGGDNEFQLSEFFGATSEFYQIYTHWYQPAAEPYLLLPTPERHGCRYISYEDERSIQAKGLYSRLHKYGGIIIWNLNEGYVGSHPNPNFLMDALYKSFVKPSMETPVAISILQKDVTMPTGASERFSALVTGTTSQGVSWSIAKAGCGTINQYGLYTAPTVAKNCAVQATSKADPTKRASVTVSISSPAP